MKLHLQSLLVASILAPALAHALPVLSLSPASGALAGQPGSVVGWGFTISNPDPNFLVVTSASFCTTQVIAGTTFCDQLPSPSLGTFTDFIGQFNFIVAGPAPESPSVSQAFDANLLTGIGSFVFSPGAALYDTFAGEILLSYDLYSRSPNDPLFDSGSDFISSGETLTAAASATASPEPSTWLLLAPALAALWWQRRRRAA